MDKAKLMKFYEARVIKKAVVILSNMEIDHKGFIFELKSTDPETQTFKFSVTRRFSNGGSKFIGYRTYSLEEERIV